MYLSPLPGVAAQPLRERPGYPRVMRSGEVQGGYLKMPGLYLQIPLKWMIWGGTLFLGNLQVSEMTGFIGFLVRSDEMILSP